MEKEKEEKNTQKREREIQQKDYDKKEEKSIERTVPGKRLKREMV